jgi:serine/threonine-protein kinase RsbW
LRFDNSHAAFNPPFVTLLCKADDEAGTTSCFIVGQHFEERTMRQTERLCDCDKHASQASSHQACKHLKIRSESEIRSAIKAVAEEMAALDYPYLDAFSVRFSVGEAIRNAIRHAHHGDTNKAVQVSYLVEAGYVLAEVIDEGPGFDPSSVPNPMLPENRSRPLGKGIYFMRLFMTWVRFDGRGNRVTLCKMRSPARSALFEKIGRA